MGLESGCWCWGHFYLGGTVMPKGLNTSTLPFSLCYPSRYSFSLQLCFGHARHFAKPQIWGTLWPQDICTCCPLCLKWSSFRRPHGWFLHLLEFSSCLSFSEQPSLSTVFGITNLTLHSLSPCLFSLPRSTHTIHHPMLTFPAYCLSLPYNVSCMKAEIFLTL